MFGDGVYPVGGDVTDSNTFALTIREVDMVKTGGTRCDEF